MKNHVTINTTRGGLDESYPHRTEPLNRSGRASDLLIWLRDRPLHDFDGEVIQPPILILQQAY